MNRSLHRSVCSMIFWTSSFEDPTAPGDFMVDKAIVSQLDVKSALQHELDLRNRLLPARPDLAALADKADALLPLLHPLLSRVSAMPTGDVVFAEKAWRGARPLHVMSLEARTLYRALIDHIAKKLPPAMSTRSSIEEFRIAPLEVEDAKYISKTDINSYYEYIDHAQLVNELVGQTGEEPMALALSEVLEHVMARRVGIPQAHPASNILGDMYVDPVRRRLNREGFQTFTFSDDFRIATSTLREAREAIDFCAREARNLGLTLNDRKTYTYTRSNYERSLGSLKRAERRLFPPKTRADEIDDLFSLGPAILDYDNTEASGPVDSHYSRPVLEGIDDDTDGEIATDFPDLEMPEEAMRSAAEQAWQVWMHEDESEATQAGPDAMITQTLLGRALPILGSAGDATPLTSIKHLITYESALMPEIAAYIANLAKHGKVQRSAIRASLDDLTDSNLLSPWQSVWLAHICGGVRRSTKEHKYEGWLRDAVTSSPHSAVAAHAAASLARLGGDPTSIRSAIDRVAPSWRPLMLWSLATVEKTLAADAADTAIERLIVESLPQ